MRSLQILALAVMMIGLGGSFMTASGADTQPSIVKWEYATVSYEPELGALFKSAAAKGEMADYAKAAELLNKKGAEGWQVHWDLDGKTYILKRPADGTKQSWEYSVQLLKETEQSRRKRDTGDSIGYLNDQVAAMNRWGEEGWEVVAVHANAHLCMRPARPNDRQVDVVQWEYKVADAKAEMTEAFKKAHANHDNSDYEKAVELLNKHGKDGWSLESSYQAEAFILKRPKGGPKVIYEFSAQTIGEFEDGKKRLVANDNEGFLKALVAGLDRLGPEGWGFQTAWKAPLFLCSRTRK